MWTLAPSYQTTVDKYQTNVWTTMGTLLVYEKIHHLGIISVTNKYIDVFRLDNVSLLFKFRKI
jgi:hypothetical protein